jgi:hypothetical protein
VAFVVLNATGLPPAIDIFNVIPLAQSLFCGIAQEVVNAALTESLIGAHLAVESDVITTKFNEKLDPTDGLTMKSTVSTPCAYCFYT